MLTWSVYEITGVGDGGAGDGGVGDGGARCASTPPKVMIYKKFGQNLKKWAISEENLGKDVSTFFNNINGILRLFIECIKKFIMS